MRTRTRTCRLRLEILEDRSVPSTFAAFDLDSPDRGPFPSDRFTVADASQLTNRRINLPLPDASTRPVGLRGRQRHQHAGRLQPAAAPVGFVQRPHRRDDGQQHHRLPGQARRHDFA